MCYITSNLSQGLVRYVAIISISAYFMENLSAASAYFPIQSVYKMTYGDENATFEPVNGYKKTLIDEIKILYIEMLGDPSLNYPITR